MDGEKIEECLGRMFFVVVFIVDDGDLVVFGGNIDGFFIGVV